MTTSNAKNQLQELCAKNKWQLPSYSTCNVELDITKPPRWLSTVTVLGRSEVSPTATTTKVAADMAAAAAMLGLLMLPLPATAAATTASATTASATKATVPAVPTAISTTQQSQQQQQQQQLSIATSTADSTLQAQISTSNRSGVYLFDLENVQLVSGQQPSNNHLWLGFLTKGHATEDRYSHWLLESAPTEDVDVSTVNLVPAYEFGKAYLYRVEHQGQKDMVDHYLSAFTQLMAAYLRQRKKSRSAGSINSNNNIDSNINVDNITIYLVSKDSAAWCTRSCMLYWLQRYHLNNCKVEVIPKL